jgi:hypothetical protein
MNNKYEYDGMMKRRIIIIILSMIFVIILVIYENKYKQTEWETTI